MIFIYKFISLIYQHLILRYFKYRNDNETRNMFFKSSFKLFKMHFYPEDGRDVTQGQ